MHRYDDRETTLISDWQIVRLEQRNTVFTNLFHLSLTSWTAYVLFVRNVQYTKEQERKYIIGMMSENTQTGAMNYDNLALKCWLYCIGPVRRCEELKKVRFILTIDPSGKLQRYFIRCPQCRIVHVESGTIKIAWLKETNVTKTWTRDARLLFSSSTFLDI